MQPAAISAWAQPLKAYAGSRVAISGWAIDAFGLVDVYAIGPGQNNQPLEFSQLAGVSAIIQGYPDSDVAGVQGSVQITAPYTEIRTRNRLGVETVVDRIWTTVQPKPAR